MERREYLVLLSVVEAGLWAGVVTPEQLPRLAAELLADGIDSPALRALAGADSKLGDPRDYVDDYWALAEEQHIAAAPALDRVESAAQLLAVAVTHGRVEVRDGVDRAARLVIAANYPDHADLMELYGLDDEWVGHWGRNPAHLRSDAVAAFRRLADRAPALPPYVVAAVFRETR